MLASAVIQNDRLDDLTRDLPISVIQVGCCTNSARGSKDPRKKKSLQMSAARNRCRVSIMWRKFVCVRLVGTLQAIHDLIYPVGPLFLFWEQRDRAFFRVL